MQGPAAAENPDSRSAGLQSLDSEADRAVLEYLQRQHGTMQYGLDAPLRSARGLAVGSKPLAHYSSMPTHYEPQEHEAVTPRGGRRIAY